MSMKKRYFWNQEEHIWKNPDASPTQAASILLAGDAMCTATQINRQYAEAIGWDFSDSFRFVREITAGADLAALHLRSLFSEKYPNMRDQKHINGLKNCNAPAQYLEALRSGGFDLLAMADPNNGILGTDGLQDTLEQLRQYDFPATGIFAQRSEPRFALVDVNGIRVAFLSYQEKDPAIYLANPLWSTADQACYLNFFSRNKAQTDIQACRERGAEYIIAYMSWGERGAKAATKSQQKEARFLAEAGVDLILGVYPGFIQEYEEIRASDGRKIPCYYSLGYFHSYLLTDAERNSVLVSIGLARGTDGQVTAVRHDRIPCHTYYRIDDAFLAPVSLLDRHHAGLEKKDQDQYLTRIRSALCLEKSDRTAENSGHLVVVLTRNYSTGLSVIRALGKSGFQVDVIASTPSPERSEMVAKCRYVRNCTEVVSQKYGSGENPELFRELMRYRGMMPEKIVLFSTDDYSSSVMDHYRSELSEVFLMPGMDSGHEMTYFMDKSVQCEIAAEAGFSVPKTFIISLRETPLQIPEGVTFPCFCKPLSSYSGQKVEMARCNDPETLRQHLEKVKSNYEDRDFLIQQYIDISEEVAVEGYSFGDECEVPGYVKKDIVAKWETGVSLIGHLMPMLTYPGLEEKVRAFMKKMRYYGLFDIDLMVSGDQIFFTEVNFRSGGLTSVFVQSGVNLPELYVRSCYQLGHLPEEACIDSFQKHFIYELIAWEDCIHGYISREELRKLHDSADIHIMDDPMDPEPYACYLRESENRLKDRQIRIRHVEELYALTPEQSALVLAVSHAAKISWMKAQREMHAAWEVRGLTYEDYWNSRAWENLGDELRESRIWSMYNCRLEEKSRSAITETGFRRADDRPLTANEMQQVTDFWKPFSFAVIPPERSIEIYTNRSGIFHPAYLSPALKQRIAAWACPEEYRTFMQNMSFKEKLFCNAAWPRRIVTGANGRYFNANWQCISLEECTQICLEKQSQGVRMVINRKGCYTNPKQIFGSPLSRKEVRSCLHTMPSAFLITEAFTLHEELAALMPEGDTLLRMTTLIWNGEVHLLASLLKLAQKNDDGYLIGLTAEGELQPWALNRATYQRVESLPSEVSLQEKRTVPFFREAVQMAEESHLELPMMKIITWEFVITDSGPLMTNVLFRGDWREHQAVTGPLFGDLSREVFTKIFRRDFSRNRADVLYDYQEFEKRAAVTRYAGAEEEVTIPVRFQNKPITTIGKAAFQNQRQIKRVTIPEGVLQIQDRAFENCSSLEEVILPGSLKKMGANVFQGCEQLERIFRRQADGSLILQTSGF